MKKLHLSFFLHRHLCPCCKIVLKHILIITFFLMAQPSFGAEPSITLLKQITQAGGSLILDLDKQAYTVTQLRDLASSLKYQATLTIKMGRNPLSSNQCSQIARARPGQVIFWF